MRWLPLVLLVSCTKSEPSNVDPLAFGETKCVVGGSKPAVFVWTETRVGTKQTHLRATKFELRDKSGALVPGVSGPLMLRGRSGPNGQGDVRSLSGLEPGTLHLEVFGELDLSVYGGSYPTEMRAFRAELVSDQGTFALIGTCEVGAAG
jgi:hypothetical protein